MTVIKKKQGKRKNPKKGLPKSAKKRRWHPGTQALREIRRIQNGTNFLIKKAPFRRMIGDITKTLKESIRWNASAVDAMHEAAENYLISVLADANLCTIHAHRVTCMPKDLTLAMRLRGDRM